MTGNKTTFSNTPCMECGMQVIGGEYHPFAACLMFKACHDGNTVRSNLSAVVAFGSPAAPLPDVAGSPNNTTERCPFCEHVNPKNSVRCENQDCGAHWMDMDKKRLAPDVAGDVEAHTVDWALKHFETKPSYEIDHPQWQDDFDAGGTLASALRDLRQRQNDTAILTPSNFEVEAIIGDLEKWVIVLPSDDLMGPHIKNLIAGYRDLRKKMERAGTEDPEIVTMLEKARKIFDSELNTDDIPRMAAAAVGISLITIVKANRIELRNGEIVLSERTEELTKARELAQSIRDDYNTKLERNPGIFPIEMASSFENLLHFMLGTKDEEDNGELEKWMSERTSSTNDRAGR